ncbi:MAG: hypothetical protein LBH98_03785 [Chitinispirillales bacterium]|jgi:hypothetical protein|nr:hypothetical protein [Chitinispirillales bacterium]
MSAYLKDVELIKENLTKLPKIWDGKSCILELKEANYQWKQMEWWAFYFEYIFKYLFSDKFSFPGDKFNNVTFDMKGTINWDLKAKAIKSDDHKVILNDKSAMEQSVEKEGFHGEIIALCDVEYNDVNRTFQKWHSELKGGKSNYEFERENRTCVSRYRKTRAELCEIIFLIFKKDDLDLLDTMKQGRNSNGMPRPEKYMLDLETIDNFERYVVKL